MNEAVNGTINQISSSSVEWWSSFVCSLHVALFHEGFWLVCWSVGWLAERWPTPPLGKKSHRDGPREEDYPWLRWGWTARHVSRGDSTVIASMSL